LGWFEQVAKVPWLIARLCTKSAKLPVPLGATLAILGPDSSRTPEGLEFGATHLHDISAMSHMNNCSHRREIQVAPMMDWTEGFKITI
jgi:hypothetical protein